MSKIIKHNKHAFIKYINNENIINSIKKISRKINSQYINQELYIIGLLDGCKPTLDELTKRMTIDFQINTIKVSSYEGMKQKKIKFENILTKEKNKIKNILIVDDIVDTGNTIKNIKKYILSIYPNINLKIFSLLVKKESLDLCDWFCFEIPNKYVIGYGMDIDNLFRDLKDIYILKE